MRKSLRKHVALLILTSALCACSTQPVPAALWVPPQEAMLRAQPAPQLPIPANATKDTDPALSIADFIDADFDLVKLYNALMVRHNALVDAVEKHLQEQQAN